MCPDECLGAHQDLDEIWWSIAADNVAAADRMPDEILELMNRLAEFREMSACQACQPKSFMQRFVIGQPHAPLVFDGFYVSGPKSLRRPASKSAHSNDPAQGRAS